MTDRVYYRSIHTGQRGYLVETDDGPRIRYDSQTKKVVTFDPREWQPEVVRGPMTRMQAARIAWGADREFANYLRDPEAQRKEWLNLDDETRIDFAKYGPDAGRERQDLFYAIMNALGVE